MKTFVKPLFFALSFAFAASTVTFAQSKAASQPAPAASYKTGIYTSVSNKLNIALDKEKGGTVSIKLKGNDGQVVYSYQMGKNEKAYRGRLDLRDLADGAYQLEITNGVKTTRQLITLSTQQAVATQQVVLTDALAAN